MRMRYRFNQLVLTSALAIAATSPAQAAVTMIGDTLRFERQYPSVGIDYEPDQFTTVVAGTSDQVAWGIQFGAAYATINPEATSIHYLVNRTTGYVPLAPGVFDGLRFSEFDHDILSVNLINNSGFSIQVSHETRSILVNLGGTGLADQSFRLDISFADPAPPPNGVPEPGGLALVGLGLLGLMCARRPGTPR